MSEFLADDKGRRPKPLDRHRRRFAAADEERRDTALEAAGPQRADQRHRNARARGAVGWPSAQVPPSTLILSCGSARSRFAALATTAKASLISKGRRNPCSGATSFATPSGYEAICALRPQTGVDVKLPFQTWR